MVLLNITEHIEDKKWNEGITELLESCGSDDPLEIMILLETYLVGKRNSEGNFA